MNSDSKVVTGRMENGGEILRNREVEELGETCWVLVVHTRGSGGGIWERIRSWSKTWSAITTQGLVDTSLLHFVGPTGLEGPWFHLFSFPFWMLGSSSLQWAAVRVMDQLSLSRSTENACASCPWRFGPVSESWDISWEYQTPPALQLSIVTSALKVEELWTNSVSSCLLEPGKPDLWSREWGRFPEPRPG